MPDEYDQLLNSLTAPTKKAPLDYRALFTEVGQKHGVDPDLLYNQAKQESINFNPKFVYGPGKSPKGAAGLSQFMPDTARQYGLRVGDGIDERYDPYKAADAQARMMKDLIDKHGDTRLALAAYNSGSNKTSDQARRAMQRIPETKGYVKKIAPQGDPYDLLLDEIGGQAAPKEAKQADPYDELLDSMTGVQPSPVEAPIVPATGRGAAFARASQAKPAPARQQRPISLAELKQAEDQRNVGSLAELKQAEDTRQLSPGELKQQDESRVAQSAFQRAQAKQQAGLQALKTAPSSAEARYYDPRRDVPAEIVKQQEDEAAAQSERERLIAQFTPEDRQQMKDIADQLRRHGPGVRRGIDVATQQTTSSLLYKVAGLLGPGESPGVDAIRRKALAGELALEDIQDQPKPIREKIAELLTGAAEGLLEVVATPGGPISKFAGLAGTEAIGRNRPVAEALLEAGKGATTGALFKGAERFAPNAEATAGQRILAGAKQGGFVGAGTAGIELATGASPLQAAQAGLQNALYAGGPTALSAIGAKTNVNRVENRTTTATSEAAPRVTQEPQQPVYARGITGAAERPVTPTGSTEADVVGEPAKAKWLHRDFGEVVEAKNQKQVGKGRVRVIAEDGSAHIIKKANLTGAGNQRAIPVKEPAPEPVTPSETATSVQPNVQPEAGAAQVASVPEGHTRFYRADPADAKGPLGAGWVTDPEYASQKYGAGAQGGTESVWYIDVPNKPFIDDAGSVPSLFNETTLKVHGLKPEPKLFRRVTEPTAEGATKPMDTGVAPSTPRPQPKEQLGFIEQGLTQESTLPPKVADQRERLAQQEKARQRLANPERAADLGTLANLRAKKMSVDDYARQGALLGEAPSPEKIARLRELEKGSVKEPVVNPELPRTAPKAATDLTRAELKARVRQGGARQAEYKAEFDRRYATRNLASFVRDEGGFTPTKDLAGEVRRLSPKETGTTGLVNKNARTGQLEKLTPEYMMDRANAEGYRDLNGRPFENISEFLDAIESDTVQGVKPRYTKLTSGDEVDFDAELAKHWEVEGRELKDGEARISLLENERSGILYDKILDGSANDADIQQFREYAKEAGLSARGAEDLITSASPTSFEETVAPKASAVSAEEQVSKPKFAGQAGTLNLASSKYVRATTPVLQEVESATQGKPPRTPIKSQLESVPERVKTALTSQFTPLKTLEAKLYGDKKVPGVDMARKFEQVAGAPAKAQADIVDFRSNVIEPIKSHPDDFNSFLFLKRVADRLAKDPDRKRVANWTPEKAQQGLEELRSKVGPEVMKKLEKGGKKYQEEMRKALRRQVESGRMSEDLYQQIVKSNDFYAPFKVLKYIENEGIAGSGRKIATAQDLTKKITGIHSEDFQIGNILQSSAEQIVRSRILAEKNLKMLELDKLADMDPKGDLIKRVSADDHPRPGYERVTYFKDGERSTLEVQRPVAQAVQGLNDAQTGLIAKALMVARQPMRIGATSANAAFQAVNLLFADLPRAALISRYGIRSPLDAVRFPLDWVYSAYTSMKGNFGKPNQLYMDWLRSGAANSTIQRELTPGAFRPSLGLGRGPKHLVKSIIDTVPKFANAIEEASKILGIKRGTRIEQIASLTGEERQQALDRLVTEVRNYSGSPDFSRRGSETRQLNLLFMFLNARIQGTAADLSRLAGRTGAKDAAMTWARLGTAVGLPTTALALVNSSPAYKDDYEKIPEWERRNYWMIPRESYFINEDTGERVRDYWRIPKREVVQLFANTIESGIEYARAKDPQTAKTWAIDMLENLSPVNISGKTPTERLESVVGSTNPALKIPIEVATGRDTFRHRQIVPEYMKKADPGEQYRASTPSGYVKTGKALGVSPLTVEHVAEGATGGGLGQFSLRQPQPGRSSLSQYPIARRFVRSGSLAEDLGMGERASQAEQDETTKQVVRRRTAMTLLSQWRGVSNDEAERRITAISQTDPQLARKIAEIRQEMNKGFTNVDRQIAGLGIESGERERFIRDELTRLKTESERAAFIEDLRDKGLLPGQRQQRGPRLPRGERKSTPTFAP